ncbi:MAG: squalene synthase HpnD [Omnitrophica WOR_2 bacterium RIFCSPHIGHO2_02_FULL_68_15]|nr:MAG: squalene synthase HpnD [Omnitrophica WOR_2 bacterium RIFCSPHIGHO2_02_FULL_68_15]
MPLIDIGSGYCRRIARASGSNFYYALWFLPPARREAMFAVYSFCRVVDDVVDGPLSVEQKSHELSRWRQEVEYCCIGWPAHPVGQALRTVVSTYGIPRPLLDDLLTGMSWDLAPRRFETFEELSQYCYYVAGVVGLIAITVFGCRRPESERFARALGTAFQMTNILRDVAGDAVRGRCYLPQEDLARFGVTEAQLRDRRYDDRFAALMAFEANRARSFFTQARAAITREDRRALTPALAMTAVYERLLDEMARVRYDVFTHPIRLSTPRKLCLAFRGALRP